MFGQKVSEDRVTCIINIYVCVCVCVCKISICCNMSQCYKNKLFLGLS
jgi:hypothetical protein